MYGRMSKDDGTKIIKKFIRKFDEGEKSDDIQDFSANRDLRGSDPNPAARDFPCRGRMGNETTAACQQLIANHWQRSLHFKFSNLKGGERCAAAEGVSK
jgi:hypothetical protein